MGLVRTAGLESTGVAPWISNSLRPRPPPALRRSANEQNFGARRQARCGGAPPCKPSKLDDVSHRGEHALFRFHSFIGGDIASSRGFGELLRAPSAGRV